MKVADVIEIRQDGSMLIPPRLRELVGGFEVGAEVWFHPVESIFYQPSSDPREAEQSELKLFISLIDPSSWPYLFDVEMSLGDEPGSLARMLEILKNHRINVTIGESRTTLCTVRAEASLVLDFGRFKKGLGTIDDLNKVFEEQIKQDQKLRKYIKPIVVTVDKPIYVRGGKSPLQDLAIHGREFTPGVANKAGRDEIIKIPFQAKRTVVKESHTIKLPPSLVSALKQHDTKGRSIVGSFAIITASSEEKMLQLTFPKPNARIVQIRFHMLDGAASEPFSDLAAFLVDKSFNFYETRMRILEFAHKGLWVVIGDISGSDYKDVASDKDLEEKLKDDILKAPNDLGLFDKSKPFTERPQIYSPRERKASKPKDTRNERVHKLLSSFEPDFRASIQERLEEEYHENWWKQGVPPDVRNKAEDKIQREKPEGKYSLMNFVEFSDYEKIIRRKDNWRAIFRGIFQDEAWVHTKLSELADIRNRTVHLRMVTRKDFKKFKEIASEIQERFKKFAVSS